MANFHSINGNEVEAHYAGGDLREEIDLKADSDGYYTMLTAGAADNLTARGDGVTASFLHRTTAGSASVPDEGEATVRSIKGRTLGWNQLAPSIEGAGWRATQNTTASRDGGKITATVTEAGYGYRVGIVNTANTVKGVNGHKYLVSYYVLCDKAANFGCDALISGGKVLSACTAGVRSRIAGIFDYPTSEAITPNANIYLCPMTNMSVGDTFTIDSPQLFDLTQMFGAGNEPSTVEEFEALYPEPYYPYDAGTLLPVRMTGVETTGFNQWDEEWELGGISNDTGQNTTATTVCRSKDYIPVFPSTEYYCNETVALYFYDADKNYVGRRTYVGATTFTTGSNVHYLRFIYNATTMPAEVCINLSWSGYRNGEYEPFWSAQRLIDVATYFPDGMRSAGTVYDELTSTEAITRVGVVDLGTLTWIVTATGSTGQYRMVSNGLRSLVQKSASNTALANITCQKYDAHTSNEVYQLNVGICVDAAGDLVVYDPNYATADSAAAFKTAMSGVMLHYALATPTTTTFDTPLNLGYKFADFGTERVMVPTGQMSAPPTMDVAYGLNAPDTLRTLPTEYTSKASDASFTAALGAFLNATITRTWDETNQRYDYTITANGE